MLALLSSVATIALLIIADWDWLLVPKLLATLCALQWSYLAGAAVRVLWDGSTRDERDLPSETTERNLGGGRILIVEDEPLMAAYLADEITAASGNPVGPAASVTGALQLIEQEVIDGAILDMKLTDGEASPVASKLIESHVPFVVLSARQMNQNHIARRAGVPIFRKPILAAEPIRTLARQIRKAAV